MKKTWDKTKLFISRHPATAPALFAAAVAFLVFLPALDNGFIQWDDNRLIYENPNIRFLDLAFLKWAFSNVVIASWYPLTLVSFALDYALWGLDPWGYHLTNVILHSANTFLVAVLVFRLVTIGRGRKDTDGLDKPVTDGLDKPVTDGLNKPVLATALVTALVFGIHPLRVESVAWVSERKDVLYAFFYLLSLLAYLRYAVKDSRKVPPYLAAVFFFACSLMSKPMAVTLPLVLLVLDYYPLRRFDIEKGWKGARAVLLDKAPFFILCISVSLVTLMRFKGGVFVVAGRPDNPIAERILVSAYNYFFYLYKMLVPIGLSPIYPYPSDVSIFSPVYAGSALLFIAVTAYALLSIKKRRLFAAVWLYYVITLLPVIGILRGGGDIAAADRYTYLACLGPMLLVGLLAGRAGLAGSAFEAPVRTGLRRVTVAVLILVACGLSLLTVKQTAIWKDTLTFWTYAAAKAPDHLKARYNLGNAYYRLGRTEEAIAEYRAAVTREPGFFIARFNLAVGYEKLGRTEEAITEYKRALEFDPDHAEALNNLGNAYFTKGRLDKARREYEKALGVDPGQLKSRYNLAVTYHRLGLIDKAVSAYEEVLKHRAGFVDAHFNLALAYKRQGNIADAKREFEETLKINPNHRGAAGALRKGPIGPSGSLKGVNTPAAPQSAAPRQDYSEPPAKAR